MQKKVFFIISFSLLFFFTYSQNLSLNHGEIHGNFQIDAQYFIKDKKINTPNVSEKLLFNGWGNLFYTSPNFSAGIRYEAYLNPLPGFEEYKGQGIPYKFASYTSDFIEITVGNYYEQFGNGLIFRSYEEKSLGYDNAMEGMRVKLAPYQGIYLKGIIGTQRLYFKQGNGIVRGVDGEFCINDIIKILNESKLKIILGSSFVSKYEKDDDPIFILPENVGATANRININYGNFGLQSEYVYKINDPNTINNMIYKPGDALLISTTYSQKGLGIVLSAKRIDNMNFRSSRSATRNNLLINYLPPLTKQHSYTLFAMYPYATQPNGEVGFQGQINYKIKKETKIGGKYGTDISLNFSRINDISRKKIDEHTYIGQSGTLGYKSDFFEIGKTIFYQDANIEIDKKISSKLKLKIGYGNIFYNTKIIEGHEEPDIKANIGLIEFNYKIKDKQSIRSEIQILQTKEDNGNWGLLLVEYSIAPKWFFSLQDMYNYGNSNKDKRIHYYNVALSFVKNSHRISFSYGKQREGIICVGGVCRNVQASNGFAISINSNF